MDIRTVSADFAVAPQIAPSDMAAIKALGFVALICNRPDGEGAGQPPVAELQSAADAAGLVFHHIPVAGGAFSEDAIAAFRTARLGADGPMLAFCRTGTRSITLDTLANPDGLSPEERLHRAEAAGYDLTPWRDALA